MILDKLQINPDRIIEVHSQFSEDLHIRLFDEAVKGKIIISTNMGESSITLPFCKTVIDFCLTRKNISSKQNSYSQLVTKLASKSNLIQRAGRVGRTSDGQVYRLISKKAYQNLDNFQMPEIKCVTLEMIILKAKQMDKTYGSNLFGDPY